MDEHSASTREAIKARARLWLRSERLVGLDAVRRVEWNGSRIDFDAPAAPQRVAVVPQAATMSVVDAPRPTPVRREPVRREPVLAGNGGGGARTLIPAAALKPAVEEADVDLSPIPRERKQQLLTVLNQSRISVCTACRLCETRTQTVFGEGDFDASIFFIGEGPGENEDLTGRPFVGRAGEKLNEMIAAMGLKREQVFIANIVKCRPPGNRAPAPDEVEACTPFLVQQIETIRPKVIVTLGLPAAKFMLKTNQSMTRLRGTWHTWRGIKLMPTFHPAYVLRNYTRETRLAVWSDLQKVMKEVGLGLTTGSVD